MSATVEPLVLNVVDILPEATVTAPDAETMRRCHEAIASANLAASAVAGEDLAAFFELLAVADAEYIGATGYAPEPERQALDWDAVNQMLTESQAILIGIQELLSETLAGMGIEDHQTIRVYADMAGELRLVADHPRRDEIEAVLNSPGNEQLRTLYHAAIDGMSLAGGLVGTMAVPEEILERVKAKKQHAA